MTDRSTLPNVVEYGVQTMIKRKKSPRLAAKDTVKKLSGYENMFFGPGVTEIDATILENELWDRMVQNVIRNMNRFREGKEHFAIDGAIYHFNQAAGLRKELKARVVEKLDSDPFQNDDFGGVVAAPKKKSSQWGELGSRSRDADHISRSKTELQAALDEIPAAVSRARKLLRGNWSRDAKNAIIDVYVPLEKAIKTGTITQSTSGKSLLALPEYQSEHVFTKARQLAQQHGELLAHAEKIRRELSRATHGDSAEVSRALDALEGSNGHVKEDVMATRKKKTAKRKVDFDDMDKVLGEMSKELDIDSSQLNFDSDKGMESFDAGDVYKISAGSTEWNVVQNEVVANELAIAIVKQDLEEEPGNFNQSFIEQHINTDRLKRDLEDDIENERRGYYEDIAQDDPDRFWEEAEQYGVETPEDEDELPDDDDIEKAVEGSTKELLQDPMAYLEEIYSREDAVKKAIEIGGIDIDSAAKAAVQEDGEGHFLSHYDGVTHTTPSGFVYWRTN